MRRPTEPRPSQEAAGLRRVYTPHMAPRRKRATAPSPKKPSPSPVRVRQAPPLVWETALDLARGDVRRLVVEPDGSVLVRNPKSSR